VLFTAFLHLALTVIAKSRGRTEGKSFIGDGVLTSKAHSVPLLIESVQRSLDLLELLRDSLLLAQCHLLLLNGIHPCQSPDRLIKTHGLRVLSGRLGPSRQCIAHH
jgi:hypothetical protein